MYTDDGNLQTKQLVVTKFKVRESANAKIRELPHPYQYLPVLLTEFT